MADRRREAMVKTLGTDPAPVLATDPRDHEALRVRDRVASLEARLAEHLLNSRADATKRAYRGDWTDFMQFCEALNVQALPATDRTVALYMEHLAKNDDGSPGLKPATISRRLVSISKAHFLAGLESPTKSPLVHEALSGIRRERGVQQTTKQSIHAVLPQLLATLEADKPANIRDRALLLFGEMTACRRSELAALRFEDIDETDDGLVVLVRKSKTDQVGAGQRVAIPWGPAPAVCPVQAYLHWKDLVDENRGSVFRPLSKTGTVLSGALSDRQIARIVQRTASKAGLDPTLFGGHSLRRGFASAGARVGLTEREIMRQTRHKTPKMVRRYIDEEGLFVDNPAAKIMAAPTRHP